MHWVAWLIQVSWILMNFIIKSATGISRFWLGRGGTHRAWAVMSPLRGHGAGAEIIGQVLQSFTSIWRCNCGKWCSNLQKKQTLTDGPRDWQMDKSTYIVAIIWLKMVEYQTTKRKNPLAVNEINVKQLWKFVHIAFFHFFLMFPDFYWFLLILSAIDSDMALTYPSFRT